MKIKVYVTLKDSISDPQGTAIQGALTKKGYEGVKSVRIGKLIELEITDRPEAEAKKAVEEMCEKLLANTVIEKYTYEIV